MSARLAVGRREERHSLQVRYEWKPCIPRESGEDYLIPLRVLSVNMD